MEFQETESQKDSAEIERSELPEQMQDTKRSYQEKINAELEEWAGKIDSLKAEVEKSEAQLRRIFEARISILRGKQKAAVKKLSALKRTREERWEEARSGLEKSLDDVKETLGQTLSLFKEKQRQVAERISKQREATSKG